MTREEKIEILEKEKEYMLNEDTISRQAALDIYDDYNVAVESGELESYRKHRKRLLKLQSAQPKTGHWIRATDKAGHLVWECDKCDWQQRFNTNYCPNCGCHMIEPQESKR